MAPLEAVEIERRLDAGEWLRPGEVAVLFDTTRQAVDRWLRAGGKFRWRETPGGQRLLHPEDVRRELDAFRTVHGESDSGPAST